MDIDPPRPFIPPTFATVEEQNAFLGSEAFDDFLTAAFAEGVRRAVAEAPALIRAHAAKTQRDSD